MRGQNEDMSKPRGVVSHHTREVAEIREDRELAVAYLKVAMEALGAPETHEAGSLSLRTIAEAYGELSDIGAEASIAQS
jgi:hypothetical protein